MSILVATALRGAGGCNRTAGHMLKDGRRDCFCDGGGAGWGEVSEVAEMLEASVKPGHQIEVFDPKLIGHQHGATVDESHKLCCDLDGVEDIGVLLRSICFPDTAVIEVTLFLIRVGILGQVRLPRNEDPVGMGFRKLQ